MIGIVYVCISRTNISATVVVGAKDTSPEKRAETSPGSKLTSSKM